MNVGVTPASAADVLPFRTRYRQEMNGQIVHDSIHRRDGWTRTYQLSLDGAGAGFGSVAIGGPWTGRPTLFEFYLLPAFRHRAFEIFEALIAAGEPRFLEVQTNDTLLTILALTYGRDLGTDKIVFRDGQTTAHPPKGALLRRVTSEADLQQCLERRQGGGEWVLEVGGMPVATGGILFHYNRPFGDLYLDVKEPFRRRGLGAYLLQELKRECYELGAVPCARCSPANLASRRTLQSAGFIPCAHILTASMTAAPSPDHGSSFEAEWTL